ncbi:bifunctional adenosylcobinamide kinase/adenosylcobinamide-phosphate guanylyltransferase [Fredinandcohnia salidurans]|uniref:Adenosylcobinamide kinase n=1 Tax=Fredinandcohnia salidurans TaxID=2595041 RepID=A0ABW4MV61_9BACI
MQLVIGGAFAGKRKIVREKYERCSWASAYMGDSLSNWKMKWENDTTLVVEGWEKWIEHELANRKNMNEIRSDFSHLFQAFDVEEKKRNMPIVLIMLEVGRGIVPIQKNDRLLRDVMGWIAQDAVKMSDEVVYVWNGLCKRLK